MSNKPRKKGSGRTKGSFSFVKITIGELCAKFADPKIELLVSRKQMEPYFPEKTTAAVGQLSGSIVPQDQVAKVKEIDFNTEEEN